MQVLVTGAFGYLGSRISSHLKKKGFSVVLGSRYKRDVPHWLKCAETVKMEWTKPNNLEKICSQIDAVVHCAGANAKDCENDPLGSKEFNYLATTGLIRACKRSKVSKFFYLSTAHVYTSPLLGKISETTIPSNRHPYALSNLAGENAVVTGFKNIKFTDPVILRLSNGVGMPVNKSANCWNLLINDLCKQVVKNKSIFLRSPSNTVRDFFPISLLEKTISSMLKKERVDDLIINVCSSNTLSLNEVIDIICERSFAVLGFRPEVSYKSERIFGNKSLLSISNARLSRYVEIEKNISWEIDALLLKCQKWFVEK